MTIKYLDLKRINDMHADEIRQAVTDSNKEMADKALRVLCAAMRTYKTQPSNDAAELEQDLCYVGLVGMIDPVRPEVIDAIKAVGQAGGYVYIMDNASGIPYISPTLSTDVTAQVKAKLGIK